MGTYSAYIMTLLLSLHFVTLYCPRYLRSTAISSSSDEEFWAIWVRVSVADRGVAGRQLESSLDLNLPAHQQKVTTLRNSADPSLSFFKKDFRFFPLSSVA